MSLPILVRCTQVEDGLQFQTWDINENKILDRIIYDIKPESFNTHFFETILNYQTSNRFELTIMYNGYRRLLVVDENGNILDFMYTGTMNPYPYPIVPKFKLVSIFEQTCIAFYNLNLGSRIVPFAGLAISCSTRNYKNRWIVASDKVLVQFLSSEEEYHYAIIRLFKETVIKYEYIELKNLFKSQPIILGYSGDYCKFKYSPELLSLKALQRGKTSSELLALKVPQRGKTLSGAVEHVRDVEHVRNVEHVRDEKHLTPDICEDDDIFIFNTATYEIEPIKKQHAECFTSKRFIKNFAKFNGFDYKEGEFIIIPQDITTTKEIKQLLDEILLHNKIPGILYEIIWSYYLIPMNYY